MGQRGVLRRFRGEAHRWDQIYTGSGGPVARLWDRLTRQNVRRRFLRSFEVAGDLSGRTVLDLGCGSGRYLVEAVRRGAARAVGVDVAPEMIEIARSLAATLPEGGRIELHCRDLKGLMLNERFDLVVANGLFDYVEDAATVLKRAAGWRRGTLVASFPDRHAPRALPRALYWRARGVRIRLFDRSAIDALARQAGLEVLAIERIGPIHLLIARPS